MDRFQLRRDTAARWAEVNPILLEGEVGFETDTKRRKIGDGVHRWNVLEYLAAENIVQKTGDSDKVVMSQKAVTEKLSELGSEVSNITLTGIGIYGVQKKYVGIIPGRTYKIIPRDKKWSIESVPAETRNFELFYKNKSGDTIIAAFQSTDVTKELKDEYIFTAPDDIDEFFVFVRADEGVELLFSIIDVTDTLQINELQSELEDLSNYRGESITFFNKENAIINKSGNIESQTTAARYARFYDISSLDSGYVMASCKGVSYTTEYAFYNSVSVFDPTTLVKKGEYLNGTFNDYTDRVLAIPEGAMTFVVVGNPDDSKNYVNRCIPTKDAIERIDEEAKKVSNKISNEINSVKSFNIDGSYTLEEQNVTGELSSGRYAYSNSSTKGWASAGASDNEYVIIDIEGKKTIKVDAAAFNSSYKTMLFIDEDEKKLSNYNYDSTNATFLKFVSKGDVYSFDIEGLLVSYPKCKKIVFNLLLGSFDTGYVKYIPSKKSLDWLSLKDNDDFKELKLGSIKSYFLEEAKLTAETIIEKAQGKSVIVNIVTDTHERYWESGDVNCYDETFNNIKYVNSMVESNLLVHLGDVLMSGQTSSGKYDDNEIVKAHLGKFFDRMRNAKSKSAILLGNHDGIYGGMPDAKAIYPSISVYSAGVRYKNRPFFYSTNSDKLVRCVFLCCPYSWDGKSDWAFGEEQINWLITEALNVGNNYHVIFFTHTPLYTNDMVNSDYKDIEGVINAFNNHTSFTTSYNQVADFTGKSGTKSVALICGHEHCDLVVTDNSYFTRYNLCCPIVIIANNYRFGGTGSIPNAVYYNESQRKNGTVNQDLWDTLVYRKDLSKLYMIRFGAGEDREIDV